MFERCLRVCPLSYVQKTRTEIGNETAAVLLLFDGHKAHKSDIISAFTAQHDILFYSSITA
jgi:hypothetical protein